MLALSFDDLRALVAGELSSAEALPSPSAPALSRGAARVFCPECGAPLPCNDRRLHRICRPGWIPPDPMARPRRSREQRARKGTSYRHQKGGRHVQH
jgi:hypothetical protein